MNGNKIYPFGDLQVGQRFFVTPELVWPDEPALRGEPAMARVQTAARQYRARMKNPRRFHTYLMPDGRVACERLPDGGQLPQGAVVIED